MLRFLAGWCFRRVIIGGTNLSFFGSSRLVLVSKVSFSIIYGIVKFRLLLLDSGHRSQLIVNEVSTKILDYKILVVMPCAIHS